MGSIARHNDLFEYTSGRFLFNEELRRSERRVIFNIDALATAICTATNRPTSNPPSITKLAEGGFNRILQARFNDGYAIIARIPYHTVRPVQYAVASEAATLDFLRSRGVPVPKVIGYSAVKNDVGTEYLLLEKVEGIPLSDQWFTMDTKTRVKVMRQIVDVERRFMNIELPANGSLYYQRDLKPGHHSIPVSESSHTLDRIVLGPSAQYEWWYQERDLLEVDRGPWENFLACFNAPAKREIEFCKRFGKSRLHVERYLREIHEFQPRLPAIHIELLSQYLKLTPFLTLPPTHRFSRPVLRHPDFSPSNILLNSSNDIVAVIDWQHAVVLPLCLCAGIPKYYQNWGDIMSEKPAKPEVRLPEIFETMSSEEQSNLQETMRKRLVHFYYAALTMQHMPDHFDALRDENTMLRTKLFDRAGAPWEGDSISLKYTIWQAQCNWPMPILGEDQATDTHACPVTYSDDEVQRCIKEHDEEGEKMQELTEMRELIGTDALGWVPDNEHLENANAVVNSIRAGLLQYSETEEERIAVRDHFPFDDYDEDA
ncbi:hypothetical protein EMCG_01254 [[Emmonsia] crescens]|uniref:Aminoglycoside phosphotransferase domain-containing protein n=1 Tax=[Emmonsia] crescens TaxID=73230 RepID=A0A0G2I4Z7_9EURO|nr:hypothetical protein EMCG_01254 [Emmonsia crescens UAMH 3008]